MASWYVIYIFIFIALYIAKITEEEDDVYKLQIEINGEYEFRTVEANKQYSEVHPSCLSKRFYI